MAERTMRKNLLSFFLATSLFGGVLDHVKKFTSEGCSYGPIDRVFVINLDGRPERLEKSVRQLKPFGVKPFRFSAVNGWELKYETLQDLGLKYKKGMQPGIMSSYFDRTPRSKPKHEVAQKVGKTYFCHCLSRGAVGIAMSHLSVLSHMIDNQLDVIWVFEDDLEVVGDVRKLQRKIAELNRLVGKNGWDILFTDRDITGGGGEKRPCIGFAPKRPDIANIDEKKYLIRKNVGPFLKTNIRFGLTSYVIKASGAKKILDFYKKHQIFLPIDIDMFLAKNLQVYSLQKDLVTNQKDSDSDNGRPRYLHHRS